MTDYKYLNIHLVLYLVVIIFCGGFYLGYNLKQCPNIIETKVEIRDSVIEVKREPIVIGGQPKLVAVRKYKQLVKNSQQLTEIGKLDTLLTLQTLQGLQLCKDTMIYFKETHEPDSFRIMTYAEVTGNEMIKLSVTFENLLKERIKIIERTNTIEAKQSLVKVYLGAYANVAIQSKAVASYRGGLALDAIISDKHMIGLQGGVNSFLQPEIGIRFSEKIRLKK